MSVIGDFLFEGNNVPNFDLEDWAIACDWLEDDPEAHLPGFSEWARTTGFLLGMKFKERVWETYDRSNDLDIADRFVNAMVGYWDDLVNARFRNYSQVFKNITHELFNAYDRALQAREADIYPPIADPLDRRNAAEDSLPDGLRKTYSDAMFQVGELKALATRASQILKA